MCFGQNTHETTHVAPMTQSIQQHHYSEVPHFKALDLLKRLVHKDYVLQCYYNENQHLKMLMQQNKTLVNCNQHLKHTITDAQVSLCVNN